jgi:hypothetical protein
VSVCVICREHAERTFVERDGGVSPYCDTHAVQRDARTIKDALDEANGNVVMPPSEPMRVPLEDAHAVHPKPYASTIVPKRVLTKEERAAIRGQIFKDNEAVFRELAKR